MPVSSCAHVCTHELEGAYMHGFVYMSGESKSENRFRFPGARIKDSCELPDMGAGN